MDCSCCPAGVSADPVSFTYQIHVTERCDIAGCKSFAATFPLTLTFDSGVTGAVDEPQYVVRYYGTPTFSLRPWPARTSSLVRRRVCGDDGYRPCATTVRLGGTWRRHKGGAQLVTADFDYRWYLGINEAQEFLPRPLELSAESFAAFLGSGRNSSAFGYSFAGFSRNGSGELAPTALDTSGPLFWQGQPAPVPEPTSLFLVVIRTGRLSALGSGAGTRHQVPFRKH